MGNERLLLITACLVSVAILAVAFSPLWDRSRESRECESALKDYNLNQSLIELSEAING